jgi:hypothetical protein
MADIFKRLTESRPTPAPALSPSPPLKKLTRRARTHDELKTFLLDILTDGAAPANLVYARGVAYGFSRKQIRHAREKLNIAAFKEEGQKYGRWFWALSPPRQASYPTTSNNAAQQ